MKIKDIWCEKYRPKTLEDIILPENVKTYFENIKNSETKTIPHLLFAGKPGIGKSSLARIICEDILDCQFIYINASQDNSIETIRDTIFNFVQTKSIDGGIKCIILDEADGLTNSSGNGSSAQEALKNILEEFVDYSRFIFTCNRPQKIIDAIHSRCQEFNLNISFNDYLKRCITILKNENIKITENNKEQFVNLVKKCYPDLRKVINSLQKFSTTGELVINEKIVNDETVDFCYDTLMNDKDLFLLRKYIIENEKSFESDYNMLLKGLFEKFYEEDSLTFEIKREIMITLANYLQNDITVLDKEINFFACILIISKLLEE